MTPDPPRVGVLKFGIGYDLVIVPQKHRLLLGIRCHHCDHTSRRPADITARRCPACGCQHEDDIDPYEYRSL